MANPRNASYTTQAPSRRDMLKAGIGAGGALFIVFGLPTFAQRLQREPASVVTSKAAAEPEAAPFVPNGFIRIPPSGPVTLTMPYVEMGQGTYTSIPMLIAEELDLDLSQVRLEHAPPDEKLYANPLLGVQATGNSNAIRGAWQPLREAGAKARTMLIAAAAKRWGVDPSTCTTDRGEVLHPSSQRRIPYGGLIADAAQILSRSMSR